jgi:hypothetical protein
MNNKNLNVAKKQKNDEFYTLYEDVEAELSHYTQYFHDKLIYCNCDTDDSAFVKYFKNNNYNVINTSDDFRFPKNIELLKESDIVVTNPPFSLFRDYVSQLMEYNKKFLIIGNKNSISYKEIFPLLQSNKIWLGINSPDEFDTPNGRTTKLKGLCRWFTNLDHKKRHEKLILYKTYDAASYPKYDNYDAIDIGKYDSKKKWKGDISLIPKDYFDPMGVPITFFDKYDPDQFEIIDGIGRYSVINNEETKKAGLYLSMVRGEPAYFRVIIRRRQNENNYKGYKVKD